MPAGHDPTEDEPMKGTRRTQIVAGAVAALAVAGGGAALAATQLSANDESQAVVNDAAKQLGIEPSRLTAALKQALKNRVDAAVEDGRLTQTQGNELKARIEAGDLPLFLGGPLHRGGPHLGFHRGFDTAASYLGLTEDQIRAQLESGKTLAQVAQAQGKTVDGLVAAMVADAKKHLDEAVQAGRLTAAQRTQMLADIEEHIGALVNGTARPGPFGGPRFRHDDDDDGPGSWFEERDRDSNEPDDAAFPSVA
jgi:hypothetical protein